MFVKYYSILCTYAIFSEYARILKAWTPSTKLKTLYDLISAKRCSSNALTFVKYTYEKPVWWNISLTSPMITNWYRLKYGDLLRITVKADFVNITAFLSFNQAGSMCTKNIFINTHYAGVRFIHDNIPRPALVRG